eukprot:GHUV01019465.1.p1 GENE.GHUV01019465.1~~GHUV01019465.1.p1  ORF type:complete len:146 (+),score=34.51 GHUV01019465.1:778-1215(+)
MQIAFEGKLYITDKHTCFQAAEQGSSSDPGSSSCSEDPAASKLPRSRPRTHLPLIFKISHADVASVTREPNPIRSGSALDLLQIVVRSNSGHSSGAIRSGSVAVTQAAGGPVGGVDGGWKALFSGFRPSSGLDGALALIEHLKDS